MKKTGIAILTLGVIAVAILLAGRWLGPRDKAEEPRLDAAPSVVSTQEVSTETASEPAGAKEADDIEFSADLDALTDKGAELQALYLKMLASLPRRPQDGATLIIPRITEHGQYDASFAANGQLAVFMGLEGPGESKGQHIYLYSAEDGAAKNLTEGLSDEEFPTRPTISLDGKTVLFEMNKKAIWKVDAASGERPEKFIDNATNPRWAHDGRHFTYTERDANGKPSAMIVFDMELGKVIKRIDTSSQSSVGSLNYIPQTQQVLYIQSERTDDGQVERRLVSESLATGEREIIELPHGWFTQMKASPDGKYVAYGAMDSADTSESEEEIYIYGLEDRRIQRVTTGHGQYPSWITASKIAFLSVRDTGRPSIYALDISEYLDGSGNHQ